VKPGPATFLTRDGLKLVADVEGDGARGSVILAHGGGQTRHSWALAGRRLAGQGWKTVALDLRGHGDSAWATDGDYRIERFAEDLVAVAATLAELEHLGAGGRTIAVAREMTKQFEEVQRGTLAALRAYYESKPPRGEILASMSSAGRSIRRVIVAPARW